jgi:2-polyprenyl-6-methoxyphenol hydroxylase-like FAD-dependent oxidoreductase
VIRVQEFSPIVAKPVHLCSLLLQQSPILTSHFYSTALHESSAFQHRLLLAMLENSPTPPVLPVIIIGAGISGLLLAQQLRKSNIPFEIFERDTDLFTKGGWGLTLHWSLPALKELLPTELFTQLPNTYVDRAAVERGESSTFPYFDLSTGERKYSSPRAVESQRIRVTRERLRVLLATGIDVKVRILDSVQIRIIQEIC